MITFNKPINKYILRFHSKHIELSFCELLVFRTKINSIDICAHFYDNHKGIEIISLCNLKEILILVIPLINSSVKVSVVDGSVQKR